MSHVESPGLLFLSPFVSDSSASDGDEYPTDTTAASSYVTTTTTTSSAPGSDAGDVDPSVGAYRREVEDAVREATRLAVEALRASELAQEAMRNLSAKKKEEKEKEKMPELCLEAKGGVENKPMQSCSTIRSDSMKEASTGVREVATDQKLPGIKVGEELSEESAFSAAYYEIETSSDSTVVEPYMNVLGALLGEGTGYNEHNKKSQRKAEPLPLERPIQKDTEGGKTERECNFTKATKARAEMKEEHTPSMSVGEAVENAVGDKKKPNEEGSNIKCNDITSDLTRNSKSAEGVDSVKEEEAAVISWLALQNEDETPEISAVESPVHRQSYWKEQTQHALSPPPELKENNSLLNDLDAIETAWGLPLITRERRNGASTVDAQATRAHQVRIASSSKNSPTKVVERILEAPEATPVVKKARPTPLPVSTSSNCLTDVAKSKDECQDLNENNPHSMTGAGTEDTISDYDTPQCLLAGETARRRRPPTPHPEKHATAETATPHEDGIDAPAADRGTAKPDWLLEIERVREEEARLLAITVSQKKAEIALRELEEAAQRQVALKLNVGEMDEGPQKGENFTNETEKVAYLLDEARDDFAWAMSGFKAAVPPPPEKKDKEAISASTRAMPLLSSLSQKKSKENAETQDLENFSSEMEKVVCLLDGARGNLAQAMSRYL